MPTVKNFAPSWLNEPAPAHGLFVPASGHDLKAPPFQHKKAAKPGPRRTVARRGTEVFVAVQREIRWGDLVYLKEGWAKDQAKAASGLRIKREGSDMSVGVYDDDLDSQKTGMSSAGGHRTIKVPVADDIKQLVVSPQGDYLAILTTHTVHICLIPDSSHLTANDTSPLKPKTWTLGPTTHVTSRSAVASALWHPLGVNGSALVTVTEDAVVRIWELSPENKWSFDSPALAIDLRKLADGTSLDQDFTASTTSNKMGFSPDSFDMEVAAACFPSRDSGGWSPMTLWIAMRGGDVYALCPLLPQRWVPPPTLIPALSVSIVARLAALEDEPEQARLLAQQQFDWMAEIDGQEPKTVHNEFGVPEGELYLRPSRPGAIPRLQGPFLLDLDPEDEDDLDVELTDIYVVGEKVDTEDLMRGEEDEELELDGGAAGGLSLSVVCLLSTSGQLKICLDLDGVEARWLPPRNKSRGSRLLADDDTPSLLTFQISDILYPMEVIPDGWPMFSDDVKSRYAFFVTHSSGITYVDLSTWVFHLEHELLATSEAGSDFRLGQIVKSHGSERDKIYEQKSQQGPLAAVVVMDDPDLGYFALSATQNAPIPLVFETPDEAFEDFRAASSPPRDTWENSQPLVLCPPRPVFQPAEILESGSSRFRSMVDTLKTGRHKAMLLQSANPTAPVLSLFTNAHRVISPEVQQLNAAVAELFRKCETLREELEVQVQRANEVRVTVDSITGDDMEDDEPVSDNAHVKGRLEAAQRRQGELTTRLDGLRKKLSGAASRELSEKERAWQEEARAFELSITGKVEDASGDEHRASPGKGAKLVWKRFDDVKSLRDDLAAQVEWLRKGPADDGGEGLTGAGTSSPGQGLKIPSGIRKVKVAQAMSLLDRESALVDALKGRLDRLSVG